MNTSDFEQTDLFYWMLVDYGIAEEKEIDLVSSICGYNEEIMLNILYSRTGYRTFTQFEEEN